MEFMIHPSDVKSILSGRSEPLIYKKFYFIEISDLPVQNRLERSKVRTRLEFLHKPLYKTGWIFLDTPLSSTFTYCKKFSSVYSVKFFKVIFYYFKENSF